MKFIDKMILCVFSVLMLLIAIFSCACIFGWIEVTNLYLLATKALADKTMCNILLGLNAVLIIMALKGIFFESNTEEEKGSGNGILLENDDGKLLITKETLTSIVNSVVAGFESVQGQQTRITLDENNDLSILLTIEVSDKAVIKELSNNIQIRVKDAIKKSLDVEVKSLDIKVNYIHSDTKALERMEIIRKLRLGEFDVLVGINLLREGLDIPEVSLVAILDADKEGFLRSERSLIQTIGRAARNTDGTVIMYADELTDSMEKAIKETNRRRGIQEAYNKEHNITPTTIKKSIRDSIRAIQTENIGVEYKLEKEEDIKETINKLTEEMLEFASKMEFEQAAEIRDKIKELEKLI